MGLLKRIVPLIVAGALTFSIPVFSQESVEKEVKKVPNPPSLIGSLYEEVSFTRGDIGDENPRFINLLAGYNILHKENRNEALLFPVLRLRLKDDKPENTWNNKGEISAGIAYFNGPFSAGIDIGYLKGLYGLEEEGSFERVWSYYWNKWEMKNSTSSKLFPLRSQIILSNDLEATTLTKGVEDNLRLEGGVVLFEKDDFRVLPYAALSANGNTNNFSWTNYLRGTGGLRIEKSPFSFFVEGGYQKSLNGGNSGSIFFGGVGVYVPINQ